MTRNRYRKSAELRERLLDRAEALFAAHGYEAATTRQIAAAAHMRSASVNYHFETKLDLAAAVLERRFAPLSAERERRLEEFQAKPRERADALHDIVCAFIEPLAEMSAAGGEGWANYNRFVAGISVYSWWPSHALAKRVEAHSARFIRAFAEHLPGPERHRAVTAYRFMLGTVLTAFAPSDRFEDMEARPAGHGPDVRELILFVEAGLRALLAAEPGESLPGEAAAVTR